MIPISRFIRRTAAASKESYVDYEKELIDYLKPLLGEKLTPDVKKKVSELITKALEEKSKWTWN